MVDDVAINAELLVLVFLQLLHELVFMVELRVALIELG